VVTAMLSQEDFVRRFTMRSTQIAWLLGAGASAAAGVPTAGHMIAGFKADLFAAAHKIARREIDADDPVWASRISQYFDDAHGFPPADDPREYQVAFEQMYPEARDRRTYIANQIRKGTPSFGHRVMAALIAARQLPLVFTTNFDDLIEQATRTMDELLDAPQRARLAVSALNSTDVAERCLRENDWPLLVKIHGDYQSVALKNTDDELRTQDHACAGC
jgi:NAD-dependent SIR2 family protein deacetylase